MIPRGLLIASLLFSGLFTLRLPAALAHGGTEISVEGEVRANGLIELRGEEFAPNDDVRIGLRKEDVEPISLGRVSADGDGGFTVEFHVPASVEPGIYQLAAEGEESASVALTVLAAPDSPADEATLQAKSEVSRGRSPGEKVLLATFSALLAIAGLAALRLSGSGAHFGEA